MRKSLYILLIALSMSIIAFAIDYTPLTVPNPKSQCADCYVSNPDGLLSEPTVNDINSLLHHLDVYTDAEVAVVALNSIDGDDEDSFANRLFNTWHLGKSERNTGLLLLYVADIRAVKFEVGVGLEGILTDYTTSHFLTEVMFPLMRQGQINEGILAGVKSIVETLEAPEALAEITMPYQRPKNDYLDWFLSYLLIAFTLMLFIGIGSIVIYCQHLTNEKKVNHFDYLVGFAFILCFIFPLPMIFLYRWMVRKAKVYMRKQPVACPHCSHTMRLLSEQEEDVYLTSGQIAEESLQSGDYDVWLCSHCHATEVYSYHKMSTYTRCPQCGARTYITSDVVLQHATSAHAGRGEKRSECKNCHHRHVAPYIIPVIVASNVGGGSRGGGHFGGGSWGGGFSGGGGAGGRF